MISRGNCASRNRRRQAVPLHLIQHGGLCITDDLNAHHPLQRSFVLLALHVSLLSPSASKRKAESTVRQCSPPPLSRNAAAGCIRDGFVL